MKDLVIIGGGPAGLSAALNGAAEGLDVALLEREAYLGGQAGTSSRIENYLGFHDGVSGACLTDQAFRQAQRLGAEVHLESEVVGLKHEPALGYWVTECSSGFKWVSSAVLVAVGVDYRRLEVPGGEGPNVMYGAPASSHDECGDSDVLIVGGGNSAGQAALNLCDVGARVTILVRRPLKQTMSAYLVERIAKDSRITVELGRLDEVHEDYSTFDTPDGARTVQASKVFAYIGAEPRTHFLQACCHVDDVGFIETDGDFRANQEGMFAAGDVRAGSRKRVAVATGEGAITAANVWRHIYNS